MTRLCGLDGDVGSFQIANLADHDDVRVLTQKGAQCLAKIQADFNVDGALVDALKIDFNRILSG